MKLTNKSIYALLLTSYVGRLGRTNLYTASKELNIDLHFLEQIARSLRIAGILRSVRGPGGGYELAVPVAITGDVLAAVGVVSLVSESTFNNLATSVDGQAVTKLISTMQLGLNVGLSVPFNKVAEPTDEGMVEMTAGQTGDDTLVSEARV